MTMRRISGISTSTACSAILFALTLVAMAWPVGGGQGTRSSASDAPRIEGTARADAAALEARQRFLEMFARAYFPGRTGQLLIVPREGDVITRPDPDMAFMHGSPWPYDISIPLMFAGPAVRTGVGHGACQVNGAPVVLASFDQQTGDWHTNPTCFRLPAYLADRHTSTPRYSALFPAFEADAMTAMIEREPVGEDGVADLILLNFKAADFVGHKYGPDSNELRATLGEMDRQLARMLSALEAKVGNNYLLAVTADHGMPSEPSSPDRRHFAPKIVDLLHEKFDPQAKQLITSFEPENSQILVDEDRLSHFGLTLRDLARFLESQPFLFAVFTHDDVQRAADAAKPMTPKRRE